MNGTLAFCHALLVGPVTFQELGNITAVIIDERLTGFDVKYAFGRIFLSNLLGFVEQMGGFFRIIV